MTIEHMIDSVNTFTDLEIAFVKSAFQNVVATTDSKDLSFAELEEVSRILKKPEWIAMLFTSLDDHGIRIDRGTLQAYTISQHAWTEYGDYPADHAAYEIVQTMRSKVC